jgi:hypothetical protein
MTATGTERPSRELLAQLRHRYPDAPFLALGQTVFWDEPVKAVLRQLLDENGLGGQMLVGVHDTDYFAKTRLRQSESGRFVLMAHNDGTTKDLWSAAGEISTLFGSETFPSRHDFARHGVAFERVARSAPEGRQAFLDAMTEAWGWRGLVYTGSRDLIVSSLPLREVGDGILEMLHWGFENAVQQVVPGCCQDEAQRVADKMLGWCREFRANSPDSNLTQLFQHVLPRFYAILLGHEPTGLTVDGTSHLLLFNPETASLPRFRFVDLFLNPQTRALALNAYNQAVTGSEIYTLDKFGPGALPFDLIVPDRGRGTLRLTPRVLFIETRQPIAIGLRKPVESVQELAEILASKLSSEVTLVGKAVSLVSMLAQEFIFVFNEEGSMYVRRTRQMNDMLAAQGVPLDMRPILRMRYHTWDALNVGKTTLRLPDHLAATFGRPTITAPEFAATWRQVVAEQRLLCERIKTLKKPLELFAFLRERDPLTRWEERSADYAQAKATLCSLRTQVASLEITIEQLYADLRDARAQSAEVQQAKGDHFRATADWTAEATAQRAEFDRLLKELEGTKRGFCDAIRPLRDRRHAIERGVEALEARATLARIEEEGERARLQLVRNALLTIEGLLHTNHRPSAWWLPLLDASGDWFRQIVATAQLYTEPLLS